MNTYEDALYNHQSFNKILLPICFFSIVLIKMQITNNLT